MKTKFFSILLASSLVLTMFAGCSNKDTQIATDQNIPTASVTADNSADKPTDLEVLDQFGDLSASDAEYAPNANYDKYTLVEFYLEAADTDLLITCSAKADESEYCIEFSFYGDDQLVICDNEGNVSKDKTGFMADDTPTIIAYIKENAVWSAIPV